jgi:hypothetical protein
MGFASYESLECRLHQPSIFRFLVFFVHLRLIYKVCDRMIVKHKGHLPAIAPGAWIAPTAVVCGNVTIGWVAVGDPAQMLPPKQYEKIAELQQPLNFPLTVYGFDRSEADMKKITRRLSEKLGTHADDTSAG